MRKGISPRLLAALLALLTAPAAAQNNANGQPSPANPPAQGSQNPQTGQPAPDNQIHQSGPNRPIQTAPTTVPGSNPAPITLTLDQAVQVGLQNSKQLALEQQAVNRARGRVHENEAGFLPTVGATGTFTHLDQGSSITLPGPNGQPQTITIVKQNQKAVVVNANLPIDIVGLIRTAVQQTQFQEIAARLDFNRTRNETVLNIKDAYFNVLRARAFVTVAETAVKNAQDQLTTAEAYLRAGTGTRFDVLSAQTNLANAEQNLIHARNQVDLDTAALNNVLGLDQNTPTQTVEANEPTTPTKEFNDSVAEAYQTRPEALEADANIRAAEKGVHLAERSALPSLGAGVTFNYQPDQGGFAPRTTSWAAVATLNVPIFDQGLARARVQEARADVNTARINKQVTLDTVALDVRQAYLALLEARDRLNVTTAALTQAQEQYRLAQVRFRAGVTQTPGTSPIVEVSTAQNALTQAQNNQVNAQYDLQQARAALDRAIGRYGYAPNAQPGYTAPRPVR